MGRFFAWLALLALTTTAAAQPSSLQQAIPERLAGSATPGLAVAVVERDGTITEMAFGSRDVEQGAPVTAATLFRNGSTSKMWVAAALIEAMRQRGFSLNAPIGSFVPNLPEALRGLTVHQLLTHSAGLADSGNDFGPTDEAALARRFTEEDLAFFAPPVSVFSYANPGYDLAGYVLEVVSGRPFSDAVDALVLEPVGMTKTFYRPSMVSSQPLAVGHERGADNALAVARPMPDNAAERPSGLAFTTALDSAKFARMLLGRSPPAFAPEIVAAMTRPQVVISDIPPATAYGYGLNLSGGTRRIWEHSGVITGYTALTTILPDQGVAVVLLANGEAMPLLRDVRNLILADRGLEAIPRSGPDPSGPSPAFDPVEPALAASLIGQWGQGTPRFSVRAASNGLQIVVRENVVGTLRSAGPNRLALISPEGRFGGYWDLVRRSAGEPLFLRTGSRAMVKLQAAAAASPAQ